MYWVIMHQTFTIDGRENASNDYYNIEILLLGYIKNLFISCSANNCVAITPVFFIIFYVSYFKR